MQSLRHRCNGARPHRERCNAGWPGTPLGADCPRRGRVGIRDSTPCLPINRQATQRHRSADGWRDPCRPFVCISMRLIHRSARAGAATIRQSDTPCVLYMWRLTIRSSLFARASFLT